MRKAPKTLFPKLFKAWEITHLVFEKDTAAYARDRDAEVIKAAEEAGVEVIVRSGRTLWDSDELVEKNNGKPTMTFSQVQAAGAKLCKISRPIPAPTSIPDPGATNLDFEQQLPEPTPDFNSGSINHGDKSFAKISGPNGDFAVPTMEELGFPAATTPHRGGETVALEVLDKLISNERYIATFEKPNTAPTAFDPQGTTLLSPHLHFGSFSIREFYWRVQDVVENYSGKPSQPPVSLTGQLLFRDMYFGAQAALGYSFGQTIYNSHCRFIPWHLPSKVDHDSKLVTGSYHIDSLQAEDWFQRWKYGRTGFPWYVSGDHFSSYLGMSQEEFLLRHYHLLFSLYSSALETCLGSNNSNFPPEEVIANSPLTNSSNIDTDPNSVCSLQNTGSETFESSIWEYSL